MKTKTKTTNTPVKKPHLKQQKGLTKAWVTTQVAELRESATRKRQCAQERLDGIGSVIDREKAWISSEIQSADRDDCLAEVWLEAIDGIPN